MSSENQKFKKVGPIEYEIQLSGRTKTLRVPFGLTEKIFKVFIEAGGIIDPVTGEVQQDVIQLICSFRSIGNILLTEFDENGKAVSEGDCDSLDSVDVITLFQLATEIITNFMQTLAQLNPQSQPEKAGAKAKKTTKA